MAESAGTKLWIMRTAFALLALLILYWQLLPLETVPRRWTGPDLLLVLCALWAIRRPVYAPPLLIGTVMLLADFLLGRGPGLFAALTVFVCEKLRNRSLTTNDMPFTLEWLTAAGGMIAVIIGHRIVTSFVLLEQSSLGLTLIQLIMTVLAYPLVAGFCQLFLGLRKAAPHERDGLAGRA
ncbi:rod shape-determining protein MreD [Cognatishimia sp. SS12]|uniref:rod shape-determining protein MreD n=1 Tax=Cognatishimia sp. SS12 TaxID=2979465 RepID=UPI00232CF637|nr:rod shape-determining protein MreD [Cognatishimia sp. SS12]MDC0738990.1 rod shape-determining protein MreD [Cognatishimia sp. SS12]